MITAGICNSYLNELPQAIHDHTVAGDTFKMALYYNTATLSASNTVYTSTGEVSGTGYTAGGEALTNVTPVLSGTTSIIDFSDVAFSTVTLSNVGGALIYNSSKANRAVAVLKFASAVSATAETMNVIFPGATVSTGLLRIQYNA